jgi:hypothetical protein
MQINMSLRRIAFVSLRDLSCDFVDRSIPPALQERSNKLHERTTNLRRNVLCEIVVSSRIAILLKRLTEPEMQLALAQTINCRGSIEISSRTSLRNQELRRIE